MVSTPADPFRSADIHVRAQDDIGLVALGEATDPLIAAHVETCPECRHELRSYRELISLARDAGREPEHTPPPPHVWEGIVSALGPDAPRVSSTPAAAPAPAVVVPLAERRVRRWLRPLMSVAAAVALIAAGVLGWSIGRSGDTSPTARSSQAILAPQPGTPAAVQGRATVHSSPDGFTLQVETEQLPAPQGYYEVWLYNPSINQMVAVGTLGGKARGSFTVPGGIDLNAYHVVDISAQRYNGNNTHERSVLRGSLGS